MKKFLIIAALILTTATQVHAESKADALLQASSAMVETLNSKLTAGAEDKVTGVERIELMKKSKAEAVELLKEISIQSSKVTNELEAQTLELAKYDAEGAVTFIALKEQEN